MNGRTNGWTTDEKADRLADGQPAWWAHGRTERRKYERPSTSWVGESWCADGWTDGWEDIYTGVWVGKRNDRWIGSTTE